MMTRKARLWIGVTLFVVVAFNYALIGFPLMSRSSVVEREYKALLIKEVKSGKAFKVSQDGYMLDILRREKGSIDKKILVLNAVAVSLSALILSWVVFGLVAHRGKSK